MKKLILPFSILALVFTSCSSDDDATVSTQDQFIGTWSYYKSFENGVEEELTECDEQGTLVISADGVFTSTFYDDYNGPCESDETSIGTWENSGNGNYSITFDGESNIIAIVFEDNTFYTEDVDDYGTPDDTSDDVTYKDVYIRN